MLVYARRFLHKSLPSLMALACLRFQCISTHALVISHTARVFAAAPPRTLPLGTNTIIMVKQGAIASPSRRRASSGPLCLTGRSCPLLPSARLRQPPRPRGVPPVLASSASSSSTSPPDHASSPTAPEGPAGAPSTTEPGVDQKSAAGGGKGFGASSVEKPGKEKQQQQQQQQHRRPKPSRPTQPKAPPRGNNLLVVGLGNPGDKYKMTRHNAGFLVAEELARRYGGTLKIKTAFQGEYCSVTVKGKSVGILRPITYMNNSGMSARKVMDFFKLPTNAAIVLVDEVALDFGQLRLKAKGGAGGHNGLKSLQSHLKTPEYTRLRIGVGASKFSDALSDHVLGDFTRTEKKELDSIIADACDAVEHWIEEEDMAKVMTRFNSPR